MTLALNGGPVTRIKPLPYSKPNITEDDKRAVMDCLDSGWIAGKGPIVREFEEAIADYTSYDYAIAVNSATSGLRAAYEALSIMAERSHFLVPALTFVATANELLDAGFSFGVWDVNKDTLTFDNTSDIGVSYAGYPVSDCIVADDAHFLQKDMASWKNHLVSVTSMHAIKPLSTGEGGVIFTNEEDLYNIMYSFIDHGRGARDNFHYGHNFRMPSINAALGLSQLNRATSDLHYRREVASYYRYFFRSIDEIELPPDHSKHAYHLFVIRLRGIDRDWFKKALEAEGVLSQVHYPPLYHYDHIKKTEDCPVAEDVWNNGLSIPLFSGMTDKDVQDVIDAVRKVVDHAPRT